MFTTPCNQVVLEVLACYGDTVNPIKLKLPIQTTNSRIVAFRGATACYTLQVLILESAYQTHVIVTKMYLPIRML